LWLEEKRKGVVAEEAEANDKIVFSQ